MTIRELFEFAGLESFGPVRWRTPIMEPRTGIYVVARVNDIDATPANCALPIIDPVPSHLILDLEYERRRWLPSEPITYIGKTDRPIQTRVSEFYRHQCGNPSPHAGGQIVKLLNSDLWVFWSSASEPYQTEQKMIKEFARRTGQPPFANEDGRRGRIRCAL